MITIVGVYNVPERKDVHLIEIESDDQIDFDTITQNDDLKSKLDWQVPYDEQILESSKPNKTRAIFYFHYLDFTKPLLVGSEQVVIPQSTEVPDRLKAFQYTPVD